jgi:hypothetical protein
MTRSFKVFIPERGKQPTLREFSSIWLKQMPKSGTDHANYFIGTLQIIS